MSAFLLTLLLATVPSSPPTDPPTLLAEAQRALEAGDAAGAEATFRRLLELTPTWVDAHQGLAVALAVQGKIGESRRHLLQVGEALWRVEALEPAIGVLEQSLQFGGTPVETAPLHSLLGRILSRQRAYPDAIEHLQAALEALPAAVGRRELEEERLRLRLYLGAALWESGRPGEAEAILRQAVGQPGVWQLPAAATALYQLARLQLWRGQAQEASSLLLSVAQRRPEDPSVQLDLGRAYLAVKNLRAAIMAFERAAELAPEAPAPHYGLARVYQFQRSPEAAQAAMTRYRELLVAEQQQRRDAGRQRAALDQGWVLLRDGDATAAAAQFSSLPESVEALVGASAAYQALGDVEKAVEKLERAVVLAPEREDLRLRLADLK